MRVPAVVVVVSALLAVPAAADIAPDVFHGGSGIEVDDPDVAAGIEMKKEHVVITLHNSQEGAFAVVDATFSMSAAGLAPAQLKVLFPGGGVRVGGAVHPKLSAFHAFVDGKPVAIRADDKTHTSKSGPPGREYTKSRTETWHEFPAVVDDDTTIRVRYAVAASSVRDAEGYEDRTRASVSYILHTGALWAKAIGAATIEIRAGDNVDLKGASLRTLSMPAVIGAPPVLPAGAVRSADAITWTQTQLEPSEDDDVEVVFASAGPTFRADPSEELAKAMAAAATATRAAPTKR